MGRSSRYRKTATIKRVAKVTDGYGGFGDGETTIDTGYRFMHWNLSAWDRQAVVGEHGLEPDTVVRLGAGEYNENLQNLDVLDVSATERWQVLSANPNYGYDNDTPVSFGLILAKAGPRP